MAADLIRRVSRELVEPNEWNRKSDYLLYNTRASCKSKKIHVRANFDQFRIIRLENVE